MVSAIEGPTTTQPPRWLAWAVTAREAALRALAAALLGAVYVALAPLSLLLGRASAAAPLAPFAPRGEAFTPVEDAAPDDASMRWPS